MDRKAKVKPSTIEWVPWSEAFAWATDAHRSEEELRERLEQGEIPARGRKDRRGDPVEIPLAFWEESVAIDKATGDARRLYQTAVLGSSGLGESTSDIPNRYYGVEVSRADLLAWLPADPPGAGEAVPVDIADLPGDSAAERRARRFLFRLMSNRPEGLGDRTKPDFVRVFCERRQSRKVSGRSFDRIWNWAITKTGAVAYRKSGPRGPHTSRRRSK